MAELEDLLIALQQGDSFFPSGALSFSWGLEQLVNDGVVASASDLERFLEQQLHLRWATCDRAVLTAAHRAGDDLDGVAAADELFDAMTLPQSLRSGSTRAGSALLSVHLRLESPRAADYQRRILDGAAPGHLAVVQGLLWGGLGLDEKSASALSGYSFAIAVLSAAVRLGLIGHLASQTCLSALRPRIAELCAEAPPPLGDLSTYAPLADVAAMRHETAELRLFAN